MNPERTDGTGPRSDDEKAPETGAASGPDEKAAPAAAPVLPEDETAAALRAVEASGAAGDDDEDEADEDAGEDVDAGSDEDDADEDEADDDDADADVAAEAGAADETEAPTDERDADAAGVDADGEAEVDDDEDEGSVEDEEEDDDEEDLDDNVSDAEAAAAAAIPKPPTLPPRWDLENLKGPATEAEVQRHKKSHVAPALIAIDRIDEDGTFQLREPGELSKLATDIARLGQLFPVELRLKPPDRFQVISGFRRVAALRFLQRDKVLARLHTDLSDEDALLMALASAIHVEPVSTDELVAVRERLQAEGRLSPAARDMLEKALAEDDSLAPENVEEEIDADELADDVTVRLGEINQDLALLAEVFSQLDAQRKEELLKQLAYSADLVAFLGGK